MLMEPDVDVVKVLLTLSNSVVSLERIGFCLLCRGRSGRDARNFIMYLIGDCSSSVDYRELLFEVIVIRAIVVFLYLLVCGFPLSRQIVSHAGCYNMISRRRIRITHNCSSERVRRSEHFDVVSVVP